MTVKKHFELTTNVQVKWGRTLYQIRATMNFGSVKKYELGGWIEDVACIAENDVWLYPDVMADRDARFHRGEFRGGEFRGGVFRGGEFRGGEFWGGEFWGGVFRGGEFRGGVFRGGEFWGGVFRGGVFWGGVFRGGVFRGGVFRGGVFKKTSDYLAFCSIGSNGGVLTAYMQKGKIQLTRGCFNGPLTEFKIALKTRHGNIALKTRHGNNEFSKEYKLAIKLIEARFSVKKNSARSKTDV